MEKKFHISPEIGPAPCSAEEGACQFGKNTPHFDSREAAEAVYQEQLKNEYNEIESFKKPRSKESIDSMNSEEIINFADSSEASHNQLIETIKTRVKTQDTLSKKFHKLANSEDRRKRLDKSTLKELESDLASYEKDTLAMLDAVMNSRFSRTSKNSKISDLIKNSPKKKD